MFIDETGWQVDTSGLPGYFNAENVPAISEAKQAQDYEKLVHLANCEPTLTDFHIFHEIDESDRTGFQSGVLRADFSERPSAERLAGSVKHAIDADNGQCSGGVWQTLGSFLYSTTAVVPVYKTFPYSSPAAVRGEDGERRRHVSRSLTAGEGFTYTMSFKNGVEDGRRERRGAADDGHCEGACRLRHGYGDGRPEGRDEPEPDGDRCGDARHRHPEVAQKARSQVMRITRTRVRSSLQKL